MRWPTVDHGIMNLSSGVSLDHSPKNGILWAVNESEWHGQGHGVEEMVGKIWLDES